MECLGGAGYIETGPMPRLFRQSPLNAIWEGSGNVIALDVQRAIAREPKSVHALRAFLDAQRGLNAAYDTWLTSLDLGPMQEVSVRMLTERLALAAQAAVLLAWDNPMADAFCSLRLGRRGAAYHGVFETALDLRANRERAAPYFEFAASPAQARAQLMGRWPTLTSGEYASLPRPGTN